MLVTPEFLDCECDTLGEDIINLNNVNYIKANKDDEENHRIEFVFDTNVVMWFFKNEKSRNEKYEQLKIFVKKVLNYNLAKEIFKI